jgi:hypothetical protein
MEYKILLISLLIFSVVSSEDRKEQLKKDFEEIKTTKYRSKILSCMAILTHDLKEGNEIFRTAISKTDKSKSYEKFITALIADCVERIKDNEIDNVNIH